MSERLIPKDKDGPRASLGSNNGPAAYRQSVPWGIALAALLTLTACGGGHEAAPKESEYAVAQSDALRSKQRQTGFQAQSLPTTNALTTERLFRWAQLTYPDLFPDSPPVVLAELSGATYEVRSYVNGNHLGVANGRVYGLGAFTGNRVHDFGLVADYDAQVCALVDCGGFGSEAVYEGVTVQRHGLFPITGAVLQGKTVSPRSMSGGLTGNVEALANVPIHVVVEDPDRLFESTASLILTKGRQAWSYKLELTGRQLTRPGRFSGLIRAFACLDPQCQTRLAGTPLSVPYDLVVVPNLALSRNQIEVSVPYGTVPPDVFIDTAFSPAVKTAHFSIDEYDTQNNLRGKVDSRIVNSDWSGRGTRIRLQFRPLDVGTYVGRIPVDVTFLAGEPSDIVLDRQFINVTYNVTRDGLPAMQFDAFASKPINMGQSDGFYLAFGFQTNRTGMSVDLVGIEYLAYPAAETNEKLRTQWLSLPSNYLTPDKFTVFIKTCESTGAKRCLTPGEYQAQARFRVRYPHPQTGVSVVEDIVQVIRIVLAAPR